MTRTIPRLLFLARERSSLGGGGASEAAARAADCALSLARAARGRGLVVSALVAGSDREVPGPARVAALAEATGRAVHRVDARLMSAPVLRRILERVAADTDLCVVVAPEVVSEQDPLGAGLFDAEQALEAPAVVCADLNGGDASIPEVRAAARRVARFLPEDAPAPLLLAIRSAGVRPEGVLVPGGDGGDVLIAVAAADGSVELAAEHVDALLAHARRAPSLPRAAHARRLHTRARIGVVIDECFDLYDEESLTQFEAAGAQLVPVAALDEEGPEESLAGYDGLIIGDGPIEAHSVCLAEAVRSREAIAALVRSGAPTLAAGGGFAYLTQGLRTLSGAFHPLLGVLEGHAVAVEGELPRGHVEVELGEDSPAGPAASRLRGYVQRRWLVRGLARAERSEYRTLSGPPDVGARGPALLGVHFRAYWPSCPNAATSFVDACLRFAAHRDAPAAGGAGEKSEASG